jgi:signal transduction histidine kinase
MRAGRLTNAVWSLLPKPTVRLRLTILYAALFLISGAALLAITFVFTLHAGSTVAATTAPVGVGLNAQQSQAVAESTRAQLEAQDAAHRQALLIASAIALGFMAVLSAGLGWIVAGRILDPLRTITATARRISARSLHERLAMQGPDDEIRELADTFDALIARLEASFQSQLRFIANVSHELRTPLARQRVIGQVAIGDPEATVESLRTAHERVLAAGVEQEALIDALLTLARGEAGLSRRDSVDLAEVTKRVLDARDAEVKRRGLSLAVALSNANANGDPILIERLVANLVDNALRHNVTHGRIQVVTKGEEGAAVLRVINTGVVLPATAVERLFQPFQRLGPERTGHRDGAGLGLSIVRAIADAHGASVLATPQSAGGLAIEVRFPHPAT